MLRLGVATTGSFDRSFDYFFYRLSGHWIWLEASDLPLTEHGLEQSHLLHNISSFLTRGSRLTGDPTGAEGPPQRCHRFYT